MIKEIYLTNTEANQETQPLLFDGQQTVITVNTIKKISKYTLNQIGYYTVASIYYNGTDVQVSHRAEWGNNINQFSMPQDAPFKGYIFFYSPYTTEPPLFNQFGSLYKLFYSDTFALDESEPNHEAFIAELKGYFN